MHTRRSVVLGLAGLLATGALAACGESPNEKAKSEGPTILNVGMPNGPQTENQNPFLSTSASSKSGYKWALYEPLMMWNPVKPADPMKPWLATKAEWSKDYTSVKVSIRDNAEWTDGQKVTADDVAFTYKLVRDNDALNTGGLTISDATVSGSDVTITFKNPQFVSQHKAIAQVPIVPKHIWEKVSDPKTELAKDPIGSGPYKLKSFTRRPPR